MNETTVFLTNDEATKFKLFLQYYDTFSVMVDSGVFQQRSASIALNFDHLGTLQTIQRADMMYSRKFDKKIVAKVYTEAI